MRNLTEEEVLSVAGVALGALIGGPLGAYGSAFAYDSFKGV